MIVLDDLSTGRSSNLDAALRHPACELVVGSVLDAPVVDHVVVGPPTIARWSYALAKSVDEVLANACFEELGVSTLLPCPGHRGCARATAR